jgi:hypothetical protein
VTLKWDYNRRTCDLSIPSYVKKSLHTFQHPKASRPTHAPSKWNSPIFDQKVQYTDLDSTPNMDDDQRKFLQRVIGKYLFYARAVDPTVQHKLNRLAAAQSKETQATLAKLLHFLNYCETHPDVCIRYMKPATWYCASTATHHTSLNLKPAAPLEDIFTSAKRPTCPHPHSMAPCTS